jgi:hypothetical protein
MLQHSHGGRNISVEKGCPDAWLWAMSIEPGLVTISVQSVLNGDAGRAGAGLGAEFVKDVLHVLVDGPHAGAEDRADFRVAFPLGHPPEHLALARSEGDKAAGGWSGGFLGELPILGRFSFRRSASHVSVVAEHIQMQRPSTHPSH